MRRPCPLHTSIACIKMPIIKMICQLCAIFMHKSVDNRLHWLLLLLLLLLRFLLLLHITLPLLMIVDAVTGVVRVCNRFTSYKKRKRRRKMKLAIEITER